MDLDCLTGLGLNLRDIEFGLEKHADYLTELELVS